LRQARQSGQVAVSRELSRALGFLALVILATVGGGAAIARLLRLFRTTFATPLTGDLPLSIVARRAFDVAFALSLAPLIVVLLVGVVASLVQTRGLFAWRAVAVDLGRLSPAKGWARLFSARTLGDVGLGLLKVALVLIVVMVSVKPLLPALPRLVGAAPGTALMVVGAWTARLGLHVALVLVALGVSDALLARHRHQQALMMTRHEVKRDQKEEEADPRHKAERRRLHRDLTEQRRNDQLLDQVADASFVAVDLDRLAVVVRYDRGSEGTPVVVAKGEGLLAGQIKDSASRAGVPLHRDVALTRALSGLAEGDPIPAALFEAVAEALLLVWGGSDPGGLPSAHPRNGQGRSSGSTPDGEPV
jgi:flagellar biosynthesis protein FlhB